MRNNTISTQSPNSISPNIKQKSQLSIPSPHNQQQTRKYSQSIIQFNDQQIIYAQVTHLEELLSQLKLNIIDGNQIINILREYSQTLKKKQAKKRQLQLPKQIANLNRIKQDNQKILKARIQYLQDKLKKMAQGTLIISQIDQHSSLLDVNQRLQAKNREIHELKTANSALQKRCQQKRKTIASVTHQKNLLEQIVKKQELAIREHASQFDKLKSYYPNPIQTPTKKANLFIRSKIVHQLIYFDDNQSKSHEKQLQYEHKIHVLANQVLALQASNSALRKQMIQLHSYLDQQDQRYQRNIDSLQIKIKRLTQAASSSNRSINNSSFDADSMRFLSFSPNINTIKKKRERNSDMMPNYSMKNVDRVQESRVIQLADLKIKFQLNKPQDTQPQNQQILDSKVTTLTQPRVQH